MLKIIHDQVSKCSKCELCETRNLAVPGEGSENCKIAFVGEAPGEVNNRVGRPFVGHGGKIFDKILSNLGLQRNEVYITNVVKCWPPGNRKPKKLEIETCKNYLIDEMNIVKPVLIVALGLTAYNTLTGGKIKIKNDHGKVINARGFNVCCTYHPNGIRYVKGGMKTIIDDISKALVSVGYSGTSFGKDDQLTMFGEQKD